jgi:hypothetical protein
MPKLSQKSKDQVLDEIDSVYLLQYRPSTSSNVPGKLQNQSVCFESLAVVETLINAMTEAEKSVMRSGEPRVKLKHAVDNIRSNSTVPVQLFGIDIYRVLVRR